jgi:predicted sulfurtransferase
MRKPRWWLLTLAVSLLLAPACSCATGQAPGPGAAQAPQAPRLNPETLKSWLSDPQVLILDVRRQQDWLNSDKKIEGAVRENPLDVKTWAANLPKDKKIVLYCS